MTTATRSPNSPTLPGSRRARSATTWRSGLLPAVGQTGPGSKYDAGHLARLQLIRRLQAEHLPLAEIRRRLDALDDDEIRELVGAGEPAPPADSALEYLRTVLGGSTADRAGRQPAPQPAIAGTLADGRSSASRRAGPPRCPRPGWPAGRSPRRRSSPTSRAPHRRRRPTVRPVERSQWERIVLAPDVELHIRRPLARAQNKQVDRLVTIARELLEEDRP